MGRRVTGLRWLDVGCGTGELTRADRCSLPRRRRRRHRPVGRLSGARAPALHDEARFEVADAPRAAASRRSASTGGERPGAELRPRRRGGGRDGARPGPGRQVGAYVWDYAAGMQLIRRFWDAAIALDPAAHEPRRGSTLPALPSRRRCERPSPTSTPSTRARSRCHALRRLRRLLEPVPRWSGPGAELRGWSRRRSARGAARASAVDAACGDRRLDRAQRARLGRSREALEDFGGQQVLVRLPPAHQSRAAVADRDHGRPRRPGCSCWPSPGGTRPRSASRSGRRSRAAAGARPSSARRPTRSTARRWLRSRSACVVHAIGQQRACSARRTSSAGCCRPCRRRPPRTSGRPAIALTEPTRYSATAGRPDDRPPRLDAQSRQREPAPLRPRVTASATARAACSGGAASRPRSCSACRTRRPG